MKIQPPRGFASDHHGESVVETERVHDFHVEARGICLFNFVVNSRGIVFDRQFQNGGKGRPSVFHISIDAPREQRLMSDVSAGKKKPPLHMQARLRFQVLRQHLAQDDLFGKILAPDHQRLLPPRTASGEAKDGEQKADSNRDKKPRRKNTTAHADTPY